MRFPDNALKKLSQQQVDRFHDDGFLYPIDVMTRDEAAQLREGFEESERMQGFQFGRGCNFKPHLLYHWADELVHNNALLDAVEDILGPNVLLLSSACFPKNAGEGAFVAWHQDGTYFGLEPPRQITVWAALSDAPEASGCMEVLAGSHRLGQLPHREAQTKLNMLSLGQTVGEGYDGGRSEFMALKAGQVSLHDTYAIHRSAPNNAAFRRIGISMNFIPTHVQVIMPTKPSATLVRGVDRYQHFQPERRPVVDGGDAERAMHQTADKLFRQGHIEQRAKLAAEAV